MQIYCEIVNRVIEITEVRFNSFKYNLRAETTAVWSQK